MREWANREEGREGGWECERAREVERKEDEERRREMKNAKDHERKRHRLRWGGETPTRCEYRSEDRY